MAPSVSWTPPSAADCRAKLLPDSVDVGRSVGTPRAVSWGKKHRAGDQTVLGQTAAEQPLRWELTSCSVRTEIVTTNRVSRELFISCFKKQPISRSCGRSRPSGWDVSGAPRPRRPAVQSQCSRPATPPTFTDFFFLLLESSKHSGDIPGTHWRESEMIVPRTARSDDSRLAVAAEAAIQSDS